jgi:hypothetical protein
MSRELRLGVPVVCDVMGWVSELEDLPTRGPAK